MSTEANNCSFTNCSGTSCTLSCAANVLFHADPTDFGAYNGQEWFAFLEVEDRYAAYDFETSPGNEVQTLRAITVGTAINYGALEPAANTGASNATTTIANLGNVAIDIEVVGTDLTDGNQSIIPANQQRFSTSTFTYSSCVTCAQLSSTTPAETGLLLLKPANSTPPVAATVYWGIAVPFGTLGRTHSGTNVFTPIDP